MTGMNTLQPLYDVKERLEYAAIAGTGLLGEDFRLRRAAEAVKSLAAASPVFGKISDGLDRLLAAPADRRAGLLLDVLSLADAVAYTQGDFGLAGDMEDVPAGGGTYQQIPCSQIQPLLTALTTTGSGRLEVIQTNWETHPEYFSDFRVLPVLVNDLGDSYGEISEFISKILKTIGSTALPALKAGFDPKGKKDMVRRVQIMEDISGSGSNDFYLSRILEAEDDVRAALVYALRHDESNVERLIGLSVTERGTAKKMAFLALAQMDCPAAQAFWRRSEKTRELALQIALRYTVDSKVMAVALGRWLAPYEADSSAPLDGKKKEALDKLLSLLPGRSGPEICSVYRRMAAMGTALDGRVYSGANGRSAVLRVQPCGYSRSFPFSEAVPKILRSSILYHPAPDLMELAIELMESNGAYAEAGIAAALLSKGAGEAFERSKALLRCQPEAVLGALDGLAWDVNLRRTAYRSSPAGPQPLAKPLALRWYKALIRLDADGGLARWLVRLTPPNNRKACALVGEHLYQLSLNGVGLDHDRLADMNALGWKKCEGLAAALCRSRRVTLWDLKAFLTAMPGGPEQWKAEALRVYAAARRGEVQFSYPGRPAAAIFQLKEEINELFPDAIE